MTVQMAYADKKPMSGLYLGLDAGYLNSEISGFAETFPPNYLSKKRSYFDLNNDSAVTGINVGYGHHWSYKIFTGIELGYSKLRTPVETTVRSTPGHEVSIDYSSRIDFTLLIGYDCSRLSTVYARLGAGLSDINISPHDTGGTGGAFHDLDGFIYGVGYAHTLGKGISLSAEIKGFLVHDSYNNDKDDGEIYDIEMKDLQAMLGVKYSF